VHATVEAVAAFLASQIGGLHRAVLLGNRPNGQLSAPQSIVVREQ
jgi:hypothetical protein